MIPASFDPVLSVFPSATDADTLSDLSLSAIIDRIRSPELAEATVSIADDFAAAGGGKAGKRAIVAAKKRLPAVTLAGTFNRRENDAWRDPSGLVQIDIDSLDAAVLAEARSRLLACPWMACLWASPSGAGLKGAVRVPGLLLPDPTRYTVAWRAVTGWLASVGLVNDSLAKDAARLAYLAHDPLAYHNPEAVPFPLDDWAESEPAPVVVQSKPVRVIPEAEVERRALTYVMAMPASIQGDNGSDPCMAVVRVLRDGFDLQGAALWRCLDAWNAERAKPVWTHQQLDHKLESVERVPPQRGRGWLLAANGERHQPDLIDAGMANNATAKLIDDGAPAAIAAHLATTALNLKLRWMTGAMQCWAIWNGQRWEPTQDRLPVALQSGIRRHVADLLDRRQIQPGAIAQLENAAGMRGIGMQLAAWPSMKLDPSEVDPPGLLATPRCVINLATGEEMPHSPSRLITKVCPVEPCPSNGYWDKIEMHLRQCLGMRYDACHRYLGACLLGRGADRKLIWLCGPGGDGKSTLIRILRYAIGDYLAIVPAEVFGSDGGRGAHLHELASGMAGARLAVALEVGSRLDWPKLKGLSGGDEQISKRLHGRSYAIKRPPCVVLVSNDKPDPPDNASAERIILAELQPPEEQDERLVQILADGGPERDAMAGACLSWLLQGCADYNQHGLGPVPSVVRMPGSLESWWEEQLGASLILNGRGRTPLDAVVEDYRAWCLTAEIEPVSQKLLAAFLKTVATSKHFPEGNRWLLTVAA